MCWTNVENKCKAIYQYQFINGKNPEDRKTMIRLIADEFPDYPRMKIAHAVDRCIITYVEPMSPTTFLTFVQNYLR
ncbi:MAG TPA: hypothetical protein PKN96_04830 [Flavobacterium sp.]|uniref:hypothetical protein n=1 Tax=Flavobacterium sp. TaxID=239 RepID=UPI002B5DF6DF|nr:hypothetical protein [Flavobacterium sp.]HNP32594.1 hypothetical protein [Flavobacterium sp.]